jgi:hypothetical protein
MGSWAMLPTMGVVRVILFEQRLQRAERGLKADYRSSSDKREPFSLIASASRKCCLRLKFGRLICGGLPMPETARRNVNSSL